jgi:hypothetical protein
LISPRHRYFEPYDVINGRPSAKTCDHESMRTDFLNPVGQKGVIFDQGISGISRAAMKVTLLAGVACMSNAPWNCTF